MVQRGTNFLQAEQTINSKAQRDNIPHRSRILFDYVGIKDPRKRYNNVESYSGIQRFLIRYISNLDRVLPDY